MSATTAYEQDERKPNTIAGFIGKACTAIVLCQIGFGALAGTGHLPGVLRFDYSLSNRTAEEQLEKQAMDGSIKLADLAAPAAKPVVPAHKPQAR